MEELLAKLMEHAEIASLAVALIDWALGETKIVKPNSVIASVLHGVKKLALKVVGKKE